MLIKTLNVKENSADNHGHNILVLFNVSPNFSFTTTQTKCGY